MNRRHWLAGGVAVVLAACSGSDEPADAPSMPAPTLEEVRDARISGVFDEPVQLMDGQWEGEPYAPGGASRPSAGVAGDLMLAGDLTGDGIDETVAFLWSATGGSGTRNFLAVFANTERGVVNSATALIGDREQIRSARIVDNHIEVDVVQHDEDDAQCCPTVSATRSWTFDRDELREGPVQVDGPIGVADLEGNEWRLVKFGDRELTNPGGVTMVLEEGRIAGQAPCNRYMGAAADGDSPGELELGQMASTMMACADESAMREEQEFLAAMASANRFSFVTGQLVLTAESDAGTETLFFERVEPASGPPQEP